MNGVALVPKVALPLSMWREMTREGAAGLSCRVRAQPGDLIVSVTLPAPRTASRQVYLKLRGTHAWNDDVHFLRAAALAMRHALVNHAVARLAGKRGAATIEVMTNRLQNRPTRCEQNLRLHPTYGTTDATSQVGA